MDLPVGEFTYRIELYDPVTGLLALARHRLRVEPFPAIAVSDPLLARPVPALPGVAPETRDDPLLRPYAELVFAPGDTVGIFLEVSGLLVEGGAGRYVVEWSLEDAERPSLLARAARWVGERLGLAGAASPVKVRWEGGSEGAAAPVWLTVGLGGLDPGLYRLSVEVTDGVSGRTERAGRLLRIREGG